MKIPASYFQQEDVVALAKDLIGKKLFTKINGKITGGIITETEAYAGVNDKASHAFGSRRTNRTETMYANGGITYVYLCYGIHHLFNIVTNKNDIPHAILIRSIFPTDGISEIVKRRNSKLPIHKICCGPGTVSKALGITTKKNGILLESDRIWLEFNRNFKPIQIKSSSRIGVDYAGKDALLPYRFYIEMSENLIV